MWIEHPGNEIQWDIHSEGNSTVYLQYFKLQKRSFSVTIKGTLWWQHGKITLVLKTLILSTWRWYASTYIFRTDHLGEITCKVKNWYLIRNIEWLIRIQTSAWNLRTIAKQTKLVKKKFLTVNVFIQGRFKSGRLILWPVEVTWSAMADARKLFVIKMLSFSII